MWLAGPVHVHSGCMWLSEHLCLSRCEYVDRRYDASAGKLTAPTKRLYYRAITKQNRYTGSYDAVAALQVIDGIPYGLVLRYTNQVRTSSP